MRSASPVPSRPHRGQDTGCGMRPFTDQTSKTYFWPQAQKILTVISTGSPEEGFLFAQQIVAVPERGAPGNDGAEFFVIVAAQGHGGPLVKRTGRNIGFQRLKLGNIAFPHPAQ